MSFDFPSGGQQYFRQYNKRDAQKFAFEAPEGSDIEKFKADKANKGLQRRKTLNKMKQQLINMKTRQAEELQRYVELYGEIRVGNGSNFDSGGSLDVEA